MKNVRSLLFVLMLSSSFSVQSFIENDWEIPVPSTPFKFLVKSDGDYGIKWDIPFGPSSIKGKATRKTVQKGLSSLARTESEFIITQCMGKKLPTAYSWTDVMGSRIAGVLAVFSRDASVKKDLLQFYDLKRQLLKVKDLEKKKEILRKCVVLKYSIKEKIKK